MNNKEQDSQLQAPQEANIGKHINFREVEENDAANTTGRNQEENETDNPTKKAWEEMREDSKNVESNNDK